MILNNTLKETTFHTTFILFPNMQFNIFFNYFVIASYNQGDQQETNEGNQTAHWNHKYYAVYSHEGPLWPTNGAHKNNLKGKTMRARGNVPKQPGSHFPHFPVSLAPHFVGEHEGSSVNIS